jgi:tetraacyldisaccharide 4'-kinase
MNRIALHLQTAWLRRGLLAWALLPLAAVYGLVAGLRRALYRHGWLASFGLPVPVVVVGNIVAGGAGKTPTVMAIVARQRERGHVPGIVSRGHGRHGAGVLDVRPDTPVRDCGDEPLLLRIRTGAPVVVGSDRVAAARTLLQLHPEVTLIVTDDGLQHLRLARQAQVLVFDERGAGNGWWLPAGPLRESLPKRVPARSVVLYNAERATTPLPGHLARRGLAGVVALADWWRGVAPSPVGLRALSSVPSLIAAAGVARPGRFFDLLRSHGLSFTPLALPDHYDFATLPWPADATDVVLTEKDAVKLDPAATGATRVWVAALDFVPDAAFDAALAALLPPPPHPGTAHHGNPPA